MIKDPNAGHLGSYGSSCRGYKISSIDEDNLDPAVVTRIQMQDMKDPMIGPVQGI